MTDVPRDSRGETTMMNRRNFCAGAAVALTSGVLAASVKDPQMALAEDTDSDVEVTDYDAIIRGSYQVNMDNVKPFPAITEPASYDYDTDVLLIGYGVGGTSAALTAVNRGCGVIAMERSPRDNWYEHAGVHWITVFGEPSWLSAAGLPEWNDQVIAAFIQQAFNTDTISTGDLEAATNFYLNVPKAFAQIENTDGDATSFQWVEVLPSFAGVPTFVPTNANLADDVQTIYTNKYFAVENALDRYIEGKGGQVLWGTPVCNLIVDDSGAVVGAKGIDNDGNEVYVHAKATIDCVGGCAANYDMVKFFNGQVDQMYGCNIGPLVNDGAGMRLCQGAGAGFRGVPRADDHADGSIDAIGLGLPWNIIHQDDNLPGMYLSAYNYFPIVFGRQPFLRVNRYGKRFMNEDETWTNKAKYAYKQPDHRFYTICDGNLDSIIEDIYHTQGRWGACEYPLTADRMIYFSDDDIRPETDWHTEFQDGLDKGYIVQADTIEELAEKLDLSFENLQQTIDEYNAMCEAGEDTAYGKDAALLYPITQPPFYGCERMPGLPWGVGGAVATDKDGRVMTDKGEVISGLFCGATDAGIADSNTGEFMCNGTIPGGSHQAITMGYISANTAADTILGSAEGSAATSGNAATSAGASSASSKSTSASEASGSASAASASASSGSVSAASASAGSGSASTAEDLVKQNCQSCHSMPTSADFAPLDEDGVVNLLSDHDGLTFDKEDALDIAGWALK